MRLATPDANRPIWGNSVPAQLVDSKRVLGLMRGSDPQEKGLEQVLWVLMGTFRMLGCRADAPLRRPVESLELKETAGGILFTL